MSEKKKRVRQYRAAVRERAVRFSITSMSTRRCGRRSRPIARQLGLHHETLRLWVRRPETDAGERPGSKTDECARMKELERENKELRPAYEIVKAAASFFGSVSS